MRSLALVVFSLGEVGCDPTAPGCDLDDPLWAERGLFVDADARGFGFEAVAPVSLDVLVQRIDNLDHTAARLALEEREPGWWSTERFRCTEEGGCRLRLLAPRGEVCGGDEVFRIVLDLEGHDPFSIDYATAEEEGALVEVCPWGPRCFEVKVGPRYYALPPDHPPGWVP